MNHDQRGHTLSGQRLTALTCGCKHVTCGWVDPVFVRKTCHSSALSQTTDVEITTHTLIVLHLIGNVKFIRQLSVSVYLIMEIKSANDLDAECSWWLIITIHFRHNWNMFSIKWWVLTQLWSYGVESFNSSENRYWWQTVDLCEGNSCFHCARAQRELLTSSRV